MLKKIQFVSIYVEKLVFQTSVLTSVLGDRGFVVFWVVGVFTQNTPQNTTQNTEKHWHQTRP
jgi:hypothetical protein